MAIKLTAAKCPCCGADLMLNEKMESGFCQYCGSKILVQAAVAFQKVMVVGTVKTKSADFKIKAGKLESYNGEDVNAIIPSNVTIIGREAFKDCIGLNKITIPKSVTTIEDCAFKGCSGLTSVTIPNSVTAIGGGAFLGCKNITQITISNSINTISDCLFSGCSGLSSITIPNSVTIIESHAFEGCSSLTNVTIPESVTTIGWAAFKGCSSLKSITIPESVTTLEQDVFSGCKFPRLTIPDSVTKVKVQKGLEITELVLSEEHFYKLCQDSDFKEFLMELGKLARLVSENGIAINCTNSLLFSKESPYRSDLEWESRKLHNQRKSMGLCTFCGGQFFLGKCKKCGMPKRYNY